MTSDAELEDFRAFIVARFQQAIRSRRSCATTRSRGFAGKRLLRDENAVS
jgi:hypothetical protein